MLTFAEQIGLARFRVLVDGSHCSPRGRARTVESAQLFPTPFTWPAAFARIQREIFANFS